MELSTRDALTVTAPKGLIVVNGRIRVRRMGFVLDPTQFTCPDGHRIHEHARVNSDGHLWCTYRAKAGAPECGALVWILLVPQRGKKRRFYAADVTSAEMHSWETRHVDIDEILLDLDATFPNAA
jgi:hypothetical protein